MSKKTVYTIVGVWFLAWAVVLVCGIGNVLSKQAADSEYIQANYLDILEGKDPNASSVDMTMALIVGLYNEPWGVIALCFTVLVMAGIVVLVIRLANHA